MKKVERIIKSFFIAALKFLLRIKNTDFPAKEKIKKILIVRQHNELGDMLCAVPLFRALRLSFPDASIHLIARPVNYPVMLNNPYLNRVIEYNSLIYSHSPFKIFGFIKGLRAEKYDMVIVPVTVSVSVTSDILAYLSKAKYRIGPSQLNGINNPSGFLYNIPVKLDWENEPRRHQTKRNLDIVKKFNIRTDSFNLEIGLSHQDLIYGESFFSKNNPGKKIAIGIHPGAGKEENIWPLESFIEAIRFIQVKYDAVIFITCGPKDIKIVNNLEFILHDKIIVIRERSIRNLAAIINKLDLFISNDTGVMHVAAATKCPVISLFGPTDPKQWAPLEHGNKYITGKNNDIKNISIEEVLLEVYNILNVKSRNKLKG